MPVCYMLLPNITLMNKIVNIGAIPVNFAGKFWGVPFKIIAQYTIENKVELIVEDKATGQKITTLTGRNSEQAANTFLQHILKQNKESDLLPFKYVVKNRRSKSTKDTGIVFAKELNEAYKLAENAAKSKNLYDYGDIISAKIADNAKGILNKDILTLFKSFNAEIIAENKKNSTIKSKKASAKKPAKTTIKKAKPVKKTKAAKKAAVKNIYQRGSSNIKIDAGKKADPPGKRKSASGRIYYEYRKNRSDMPGSLTGINKKFIDNSILKFYK